MLASALALAAAALSVCTAVAPIPVCHNGFLILRVRTDAWGLSAQRRAVIVQQRFSALISDALEAQAKDRPVPRPVARRLNGDWVVMARGCVLVTVTELDAAANNTAPGPLAKLWAERFGAALLLATTGRRPEVRVGSSLLDRAVTWLATGPLARARLW